MLLQHSGQQPPCIPAPLIKDLRATFAPASVLVHMDAQKHIRLIFQRDIHPLLKVFPLAGLGGGGSFPAKADVLPPSQDHPGPLCGQFFFHRQRDFQIDVLFPPSAVPGTSAAVVASVAGIQRDRHSGQRGFSPFRGLDVRQRLRLRPQAQTHGHAAQQQQHASPQPGLFPLQQLRYRSHPAFSLHFCLNLCIFIATYDQDISIHNIRYTKTRTFP